MKEIKWDGFYTSPKQSHILLNLGLDPKTSDCIYGRYAEGKKPENGDAELYSVCQDVDGSWIHLDFHDQFFDEEECFKEDFPAWSIGALLDIMPNEIIGKTKYYLQVQHSIDCWHIRYSDRNSSTIYGVYCDTLVDAAFKMMVWLLEHKHIKTENND